MVEKALQGKENQEQLIKQEIAYIEQKPNTASVLGLFEINAEKEKEKDRKYLNSKYFTLRRLNEALMVREIAKGNYKAGVILMYPRHHYLAAQVNNTNGDTTVLKTNFKDRPYVITNTEEGFFKQSREALQAASDEIKELIEEGDFNKFIDIPFTNGVTLHFQYTVEKPRIKRGK